MENEELEVQDTFNEIDVRECVEEVDGGDEDEATNNVAEQGE